MKKLVKPKKTKKVKKTPKMASVTFRIGKEELNGSQIYTDVLEWMYKSDGAFSSKSEWRKAFCSMLKRKLGLEYPNHYSHSLGLDGWHFAGVDLGEDEDKQPGEES